MGPTLIATTGWCVDAPAKRVWSLLARAEAWPSWWTSVATARIVPPARATTPQAAGRAPVSWPALLGVPLRLQVSLLAMEPEALLEWQVRGDVEARSTWVLDAGAAGDAGITCRWELRLRPHRQGPVGTVNDWLVERRVFALNAVLAQDTARMLGCRITYLREWRGGARRGATPHDG